MSNWSALSWNLTTGVPSREACDMTDPIHEGIQAFLDLYGEGWSISHFVVCMGLDRIRDGEVETCSWQYFPPGQPDYVTKGLLEATGTALIEHDGEP